MKRLQAIGSSLLLVPALALAATQARAEFKCGAQPVHFDRTACEKAKESPTALRQYLQRIRMIDNLEFSDYVNDAQERAWAENDAKRTPAMKAPVRTARFVQENPGA